MLVSKVTKTNLNQEVATEATIRTPYAGKYLRKPRVTLYYILEKIII